VLQISGRFPDNAALLTSVQIVGIKVPRFTVCSFWGVLFGSLTELRNEGESNRASPSSSLSIQQEQLGDSMVSPRIMAMPENLDWKRAYMSAILEKDNCGERPGKQHNR